MTTPTPLTDDELFNAVRHLYNYEDVCSAAIAISKDEYRAIESEVNARWMKMLGDGEAVWYACDTEGAEFDVTFVTTREEAADAVDCALADDPELKFEDLVTPLYTHPEPSHPELGSAEPVAVRHTFDGYGWHYMDNGSGSNWLEDGMKQQDAEPVYAHPAQHCQCPACLKGPLHWSDCAVHNGPAEPTLACDCGSQEPVAWFTEAAWGNDVSFEKPDFGGATWKAPQPKVTPLYAHPAPSPTVMTKTWYENGVLVTKYLTAEDVYKPAPDHTALLQDVARVFEESWRSSATECARKQVDIYKRIKEALK